MHVVYFKTFVVCLLLVASENDDEDDDEEDEDEDDDSDEEEEDEDEVLVPGPVVPASYTMVISKVLNASVSSGGVKIKDLVQLCPDK
jgi:hypothetical protein